MSQILQFSLAATDVNKVYMQSGPIKRELSVRPLNSIIRRNMLWKLLWLACKTVEAGPLWPCILETWLVRMDFSAFATWPQLLNEKGDEDFTSLLEVKVVNDFLIAGSPQQIAPFITLLDAEFKCWTCTGNSLKFLCFHIKKDRNGNVNMSMIKTWTVQASRSCHASKTGNYRLCKPFRDSCISQSCRYSFISWADHNASSLSLCIEAIKKARQTACFRYYWKNSNPLSIKKANTNFFRSISKVFSGRDNMYSVQRITLQNSIHIDKPTFYVDLSL